jgi:secreted trypsin-like serine protease
LLIYILDPFQWFENRWGYIIGYGRTTEEKFPKTMQFTAMRLLPRYKCNQQWPREAYLFVCPYSGVSSACNGDSGGGFVVPNKGAWRLVGVASKVYVINDQCDVSKSSGYVRVAWHSRWIRHVMMR